MISRADLQDYVYQALKDLGGSGSIVDVAKHIWKNHRIELEKSGDLFFTWQYDMRWAATKLRQSQKILPVEVSQKGEWRIK